MAKRRYTKKELQEDARLVLAQLQSQMPGPYYIHGFTPQLETLKDLLLPDAPHWHGPDRTAHPTFVEVYREFRRHVPEGQYHILVETGFNPARPQTGRPLMLGTDAVETMLGISGGK